MIPSHGVREYPLKWFVAVLRVVVIQIGASPITVPAPVRPRPRASLLELHREKVAIDRFPRHFHPFEGGISADERKATRRFRALSGVAA